MDKNTATGLILISLMLIIYFQFFSPTPEEEPIQEPTVQEYLPEDTDTQELEAISDQGVQISASSDTLNEQELASKYGIFAPGGMGEEKTTVLENENLTVTFNSKGAVVENVLLKDFLTFHKEPLVILGDNSSKISFLLSGSSDIVDINELYYQVEETRKADTLILKYTLDLGSGRAIQQTYSLPPQGYQIGYSVKFKGLNQYLQNDPTFQWTNHMRNLENDVESSRLRATVNYYTTVDEFDGFAERSSDLKEENLQSTKWVSFKQHFFSSGIIAKDLFTSGNVSVMVDESLPNTVKIGQATLKLQASEIALKGAEFTYYFGPNNYQILKKVAPKFDKNIYLGWPPINWVNKFIIIPIFNFLEKYMSNYGLIIIILVVIVKLALSPLSYKSYKSMAKTKVLKPELDEIKVQFPDDMQKQQQEQMKLYQQVGVNPLSGCVPLVLQMPILFSMFYFFPSSIELRQESFLWADDLSTYDSVLELPFHIPIYGDHVSLFVVLMTASTILYTWSNNQMTTVQGPMKSMSYMMPVIFMFVLNSFPAALSFYYFVSNLVTFGQQALIRKFVDEDKIKKILDENRLRNRDKKKSKFQLKIEQAMKAGEESKKKKTSK